MNSAANCNGNRSSQATTRGFQLLMFVASHHKDRITKRWHARRNAGARLLGCRTPARRDCSYGWVVRRSVVASDTNDVNSIAGGSVRWKVQGHHRFQNNAARIQGRWFTESLNCGTRLIPRLVA